MKDKVLNILGEVIGVEPEDINPEDSLREDLHMNSVDLTEFAEKLTNAGFAPIDMSEIETVDEVIEELNLEEV